MQSIRPFPDKDTVNNFLQRQKSMTYNRFFEFSVHVFYANILIDGTDALFNKLLGFSTMKVRNFICLSR